MLLLVAYVNAAGQFSNKDWYISPKISFADYSDRNDWDGYSIHKVPPISVAAEKGLTDFLSVGALMGLSRDKYVNDTLASNVHRYSNFALGALANVHVAGWIEQWTNYNVFLGDWDIYAGLSCMLEWQKVREEDVWNQSMQHFNSAEQSELKFNVRPMFGVRYFVTDNVCMLLELGHGNMGLVTTGITFRIPHLRF